MAGEFETFVSDIAGPLALTSACSVVDKAPFTSDELRFDVPKKQRKPDSEKRGRSSTGKRPGPAAKPEANRRQGRRQKEEEGKGAGAEAGVASGTEADSEDGEGAAKAAPRSKKEPDAKTKTEAKAFAEEVAEAKPARPTPTPPPMEDLLDLGQNDLLDLDLEPEPFRVAAEPEKKQRLTALAPPASVPAMKATAAQDDLLDLDLGAAPAPAPAAGLPDLFA